MAAKDAFADSQFILDERLGNDTVLIESWPLCDLRIMNEARYPWFILVPRVIGVKELYELSSLQREQFIRESDCLSRALVHAFNGDKLNVAALGNIVAQLHIHHIVRFESDAAWPAPVWGKFPVEPMKTELLSQRLLALREHLGDPV